MELELDSPRARHVIEGWYPAPIARAFSHSLLEPDDPLRATALASAIVHYVGIVAVRQLLARPETWRDETKQILFALKRPVSDGTWLAILRHAHALAEPLDAEVGRALERMVSLRNELVHGGRGELLPELRRSIAAVLSALSWLRFHRLFAPRSTSGDGELRATLYRGHAAAPAIRVITEAQLQTGRVHLSIAGQAELLPMYPCLIEHPCAECGRAELFVFSHFDRGRAVAIEPVTHHQLERSASEAAGRAMAALVDRLDKQPGAIEPRHLEIGGDLLVARRRLAPGEVIDQRWRIERFIASGGMADVYAARDTATDREVALKMLPLELTRSEEALRRFYGEIRQARDVVHANVVRYVDHGEENGDHYLVLELARCDLAALMQERRLAPEEVLDLACQLAEGLHAIHQRGIVHRDLKPANVLLFGDGIYKVADFGVSRERGDATVTLTGFLIGTPEYLAPELAMGRAHGVEIGRGTDVYSLGVILYEALTGDVPFKGRTPLETTHLHLKEKPEWIKRRAPELSDGFAKIVMKCLRKDPAARYRSALELFHDLMRLRDDPSADPVQEREGETVGLGPGARLGPYQLGVELERRGEVTLYEATHVRTGANARVGVLGHSIEADGERRDRALERLRAARRSRHPALIAILDVDEDHGYTWFAVDAPGERVRPSPQNQEQAIRHVLDLAAGLLALEDQGEMHGDVRPEHVFAKNASNPFLQQRAQRILLDFPAPDAPSHHDTVGLARVLESMIEPSGELARVVETAKQGGYPTVRALGADLATALKAGTPRSGGSQKLVLSMNGEQLTFEAGTDRRIILGRASSCEVVLATSASSRKHAMLIAEGERWFLRDLGSSNGTYLNGSRIAESTELKHGDRIGIGDAIITVVATK